ncbi:MAG TPA: type II toxin-antitoxin system VapC family toxin [bacterium]|nr:type II toxin-antitoxin system VapC family toxin [bacterium]
MLFDTDILIWVQRGNSKAADWVDHAPSRSISVQTYLELLQDSKNNTQLKETKKYLFAAGFQVVPFNEGISHRAMVYLEEYGLSHSMGAGDALIAATAVENGLALATGNAKHFRAIRDLDLKIFKP